MSERREASSVMRFQKRSSFSRARFRPPSTRPHARSTALTAPALAPLIVSRLIVGSCNNLSRTPQVKAPNDPPPCNARESCLGGQARYLAVPRFLPQSYPTGLLSWLFAVASVVCVRSTGLFGSVDQIAPGERSSSGVARCFACEWITLLTSI